MISSLLPLFLKLGLFFLELFRAKMETKQKFINWVQSIESGRNESVDIYESVEAQKKELRERFEKEEKEKLAKENNLS